MGIVMTSIFAISLIVAVILTILARKAGFVSKGCIQQAYWVNTGKNEILEDVLRVATDDITERLLQYIRVR